jgi:UPF0271 protein
MSIDLNCDMGESFGPWPMGNDAALMQHITSANIACGFHAGDPIIMQKTVRLALEHGVAIGAHPGYPDLQGFGRRNMQLSPDEVYAAVLYQIGALQAIARAEGAPLHHVKPHGALYNAAAKDRALADAIARAVRAAGADLLLYGLSGSALIAAGEAAGLHTCSEVFADRTYQSDGSLTPRTQPGALIEDTGKAVEQALEMVRRQRVKSLDGQWVPLQADTICLHGDGPHAVEFAQALFAVFKREGIEVKVKM